MTRWSLIVCALWLGLLPPHAWGQPRRAAAHAGAADPVPVARQSERDQQARFEFERGRRAYDEGAYRSAWAFFHNAYRLSGRVQLLFNIGQTADRLGHDSEALTAFKMYLERLPAADNRRDVENRIRALEERVRDSNRAPPPPLPGSVEGPEPQPTAAAALDAPAPVDAPPPPPPAAALDRGSRPTRTGFYLRVGLGAGLRRDGVSGGADGSVSGFGFAGELAAGTTLFPGFVLGGGFYSDLASSPTFEADNGYTQELGSAHLTMFGPMADWYLNPSWNGLHVQAALTFAVIAIDYRTAGIAVGRDASGIGLVVGVGYDWAVANEWAVGALFRLSLATLSDDTRSHGVFAPSLVATLTWF